jgi:hypothetical protein
MKLQERNELEKGDKVKMTESYAVDENSRKARGEVKAVHGRIAEIQWNRDGLTRRVHVRNLRKV